MSRKVEDSAAARAAARTGSEDGGASMDMSYDDGTSDPYRDNDEQDDDDDDDEQDDDEQSNKHQRLMRACDHCRRKKVKCNGAKPACAHCLRMKLECNYSPLVRKKRTRRSVIDKLQERLESMEQMLQPLVERLQPNDPVVSAGIGGFGLGFGFAPAPPPTISHPLGLPMPQTTRPGGPQSVYIPQPGAQGIPRDSMYLVPSETSAGSSDLPFPPPHVIEELMEIAITRMSPTAPPVSWARLLRRLHSGQLPEFIICATIALAARFSNRPEFNCTPRYNAGREYAKRAAELVSGLVDRPDPDVVFCLVMLSLYEWGCGRGESAWTYTGMATRLAQRCRLHLVDEEDFNENVNEESYTWANAEWRRRLWWSVYSGDRTSVIFASRPATVHDDDCVVNLPSHDHDWVMGTVPVANDVGMADSQLQPGAAAAADDPHTGGRLPDSWWLVVELYRMCSRISEFVNRRRRPVRTTNIPRRQMFDVLDRELEDLRGRFIPGMEFPPRTEWLLSGYANLGDGPNGMSNVRAIYFNLHLMYYASKIILYRSELPEYQHETISTELIDRAKSVCIDSAHKQAEVIRWALDSVPVEEWDPKVGVWSLQGASIHVNAALSPDNAVAEQSRRDLEAHLRLHVASDQYYHFNMAIVTMLHHVFNLRKKQRLALESDPDDAAKNSSTELATSENKIVIHHRSDSDPWIVPRCSSFLGFTYNYSQLRGILNNAMKQTTYSPPQAITEGGDSESASASRSLQKPSAMRQLPTASTGPLSMNAALASGMQMLSNHGHRRMSSDAPVSPYNNGTSSNGLWSPASAHSFDGVPANIASATVVAQAESGVGGPAAEEQAARASKRSYGGTSGPGNNGGKAAAADAQQHDQLQRLEELRARVVLLQQLSGNQSGGAAGQHSSGTGVSEATLAAVAAAATSSSSAAPAAGDGRVVKDVNGFLNNFAESIGSMASQLSTGPTPYTSATDPRYGSQPVSDPMSPVFSQQQQQQQQALLNEAWLTTGTASLQQQQQQQLHSAAVVHGANAAGMQSGAGGSAGVSPSDASFGNAALDGPKLGYSAEQIQGLMRRLTTFHSPGAPGPQ